MQQGPANELRCCTVWSLSVVVAAGCASGTHESGALSPALAARCRVVEQAYRAGAADYARQRDELVSDPVAATWLTRMFVRDLFQVREGRPLGDDVELLRSAARITDPVEAGAIAEIRALGVRAVPTLVGDLLLHEQPQPRELGIELLAAIGAPAIPAVQQVARTGESRHRRAAARTLGRIGVDEAVFATLRELAGNDDYTVRADALRSLRTGGASAVELLVQRLREDPDPFVRRVACQTLGEWRSTPTALALVDYLERCKQEQDWPGERAAQASLQHLAGSRGPRTPAAWRAAAAEFGPLPPSPTNSSTLPAVGR